MLYTMYRGLTIEHLRLYRMLLAVLVGLLLAALVAHMAGRWKYRHLPSPGICLPLLGHVKV